MGVEFGQLLCFRCLTLLSAQYILSVKPVPSEATWRLCLYDCRRICNILIF